MKRLATLLALMGLTFAAQAETLITYQTADGGTAQALPQVLVKYKPGRAFAARNRFAQTMGIPVPRKMSTTKRDKLAIPAGESPEKFLKKLQQDSDVENAEFNGVWRAFDTPNDPQFSSNQYYLQPSYTDAQGAWDITTGSATVVVAVIDTGVTLDHDDISTTTSLWNNPSPSGTSGIHGTRIELDWNGDGDCVDTVAGVGAEQCASTDVTDDDASVHHGTRVTSLIVATTNNNLGMASVARGCRVMAVKALNSTGFTYFDAVADAIRYAVDNGASVINMSLGGSGTSSTVQDEVDYATAHNVVVVAASGNAGNNVSVQFPAAIPVVISVGATDSSNSLASFSCTGNGLDVVAPGVSILAAIPTDTYTTGNGTSFASPIVAGIAALMRSIAPNSTVDDITKYIRFTATDLGVTGYDTAFGFGLVNARRALLSLQSGTIFYSNPSSPNDTFSYPNPFRPLTTASVTFSIPASLGSSDIEIKIYTQAGELVRTLHDIYWDGKNDDGTRVASGLYYYHLKTSSGDTKGKITVIK